jgi:hypothetical protein
MALDNIQEVLWGDISFSVVKLYSSIDILTVRLVVD